MSRAAARSGAASAMRGGPNGRGQSPSGTCVMCLLAVCL